MLDNVDVNDMSAVQIKNSLSKMGINLPSRRATREELLEILQQQISKASVEGKTSCPPFKSTPLIDEGTNNFLDIIKSGRPSLQHPEKEPSPFKKRLSETPSNLFPSVNLENMKLIQENKENETPNQLNEDNSRSTFSFNRNSMDKLPLASIPEQSLHGGSAYLPEFTKPSIGKQSFTKPVGYESRRKSTPVGPLLSTTLEKPSYRKSDTEMLRQSLPQAFANPSASPFHIGAAIPESSLFHSGSKSSGPLETSMNSSGSLEQTDSVLQSNDSDTTVSQLLGSYAVGYAKNWIVKVVVGLVMAVFIACMLGVFTASIPPADTTTGIYTGIDTPHQQPQQQQHSTEMPPTKTTELYSDEEFKFAAQREYERIKDEIEFKKEVRVTDIERHVKERYAARVWENILDLKETEGSIKSIYTRTVDGPVEFWITY